MTSNSCGAIILAAGLSTRMGRTKALLPVGMHGRPLLEAVIGTLRIAGVRQILVVTGHDADAVTQCAHASGAQTVHNADYRDGMWGSVRTGLSWMHSQSSCSRILLTPVDAAFFTAATIRGLTQVSDAFIVLPSFRGVYGHPPSVPMRYVEEALHWNGENGLRGFFASLLPKHMHSAFLAGQQQLLPLLLADAPEEIAASHPLRAMPVFDAGASWDMDTPDEYDRIQHVLSATSERAWLLPEEAWELLIIAGLGRRKLLHSQAVAVGAIRLADAFARAGKVVHGMQVMNGGLLHDCMRNEPFHDKRGAFLLARLGYGHTAFTVGCHTNMPVSVLSELGINFVPAPAYTRYAPRPDPEYSPLMTRFSPWFTDPFAVTPDAVPDIPSCLAAMCIYIADKYFFGEKQVRMADRFAAVKAWYYDNPSALTGITARERSALEFEHWCREQIGADPFSVIATPSASDLEKRVLELQIPASCVAENGDD